MMSFNKNDVTVCSCFGKSAKLSDSVVFAGMVRQTSLMEAKAVVGTCPDMCPEKERYGRASQRRLSLFELCDTDPLVSHTVHEVKKVRGDEVRLLVLRPLSRTWPENKARTVNDLLEYMKRSFPLLFCLHTRPALLTCKCLFLQNPRVNHARAIKEYSGSAADKVSLHACADHRHLSHVARY